MASAGSASVDITADVSKLAGQVLRDLEKIMSRVKPKPITIEGDFGKATNQAGQASEKISDTFEEGAKESEESLADVDEDFNDPQRHAKQAADSIGGDFEKAGSRAGKALASAGKMMVTALAAVTAAAAAALAAVTGLALVKGLGRLLDIEDAQAKLRGLGHDAKTIEMVMTSALNSVRGTAFGLGEAATIAATAVAAGVKPGQDLERTLKLIADTATIAGTSLEDIGSIFNQIAAGGKIAGDDLLQFQDRGIPVLQFLAKELGVTTEAARKMVSEGKVSFDDFRNAIESNISGAALESGNTTRGAFANMQAALGRVGANLLSGVFPMFKDFFNGITNFLGPVEDAAKSFGQSLGEAFTVLRDTGSLTAAFETLRSGLDPSLFREVTNTVRDLAINGLQFLSSNASEIVGVILSARGAVIEAVTGIFMGIVQALPQIIPEVVSGAISLVTTIVDTLVQAVPLLVSAAGLLINSLVEGLIQSLPRLIWGATQIVTSLITGIITLIPIIIDAGLQLIQGLITGILVAIPEIQAAIIGMMPSIISAITEMTPALMALGINLLVAIITGISQAVPQVIDTIQNDVIPSLINAIVNEGPKLIEQGANAIKAFLEGVLQATSLIFDAITNQVIPAITNLLENNPEVSAAGTDVIMTLVKAFIDNVVMIGDFIVGTFIPEFVGLVVANLPAIINLGIKIIVAILAGLIQAFPQIVNAILFKVIPGMVMAFLQATPKLVMAGSQIVGGLVKSISSTWSQLARNVFNMMKNGTINFFSGASGWLVSAGRRIIDGLVAGLQAGFERVRSTLSSLTSMLPDWKGPAEVDRKILRASGRMVMEGFRLGIEDERRMIQRSLADITQNLPRFTGRTVGGDGSSPVTPGVGAIHVHVSGVTGEEAGRKAAEAILVQLGHARGGM